MKIVINFFTKKKSVIHVVQRTILGTMMINCIYTRNFNVVAYFGHSEKEKKTLNRIRLHALNESLVKLSEWTLLSGPY